MQVLIIMGSKSDQAVADKAAKVFDKLGVSYKMTVASAHRTPERVKEVVKNSDAEVFIAIAGLAAALPGAVAALTSKPVIGVPVSGKLNLDSILSIVQMPPGIPVAGVGLDRGDNAALLAASIIALIDKDLMERVVAHKDEMRKKVELDAKTVEG